MEYHEAANTLERLRHSRPKLGTETTATLLSHLGNPQDGLTAVQVAGSNGKGSTASMLARILREAGATVGLYTSPDLNDRRDRIQVCGRKIPKHEVVRFVEEHWPHVVDLAVEGDEPTFFEAFTALALWHFDREDVDVAVLEVGIGGRYDATSVVDPVAAAVTAVSLEHTDIIGSTVTEIARDKVHVAPADAPLVTGTTGAALETIREETDVVTVGGADADVRTSASGHGAETEATLSLTGPDWAVETRTSLLGDHQAINAGIAAALAGQLEAAGIVDVSERDIAAGIRNTTIPGRFEVMNDAPLVVLDGAHNPAACVTLADTLHGFAYDDLHLVFGAMREKDHAAMCASLPAADHVYLTAPAVDRAQDTETLEAVFSRETAASLDRTDSVSGAVERALESADETDCVLVTGSLYVVGEARDRWTRTPRQVPTENAIRARSRLRSADVPAPERAAAADNLVSRTVRLSARREAARVLQAKMLGVGGTASLSGIAAPDSPVDVVLGGTLAQFQQLLDLIGPSGEGYRYLASQVERALDRSPRGETGDQPWSDGTAVMGILNVTPDSFHDGGTYGTLDAAVARATEMVDAGADVVDVGGESTRPGADPVSVEAEAERVVPVVERLADVEVMVSVDTRKPAVAEAALEAGADMVNDVTGLEDASMRDVVARWDVPVVVMHSLSAPVDPDRGYAYDDVVDDVFDALVERLLLAERAGIDRSRIVVDPGLGFGKRPAESFALLDRLSEFRALGTPVMVGHSHKSMFERTGCGPDERLAPTVAATALAAERGADIVRVHDVAENAAAVATARQTTQERGGVTQGRGEAIPEAGRGE